MQNSGLDEAQAGIKISGKNINNLKYADDTTLMAESKEEVKSLLMKVKEENEKASLKLNIQKTKIMAFSPIFLWQIDRKTMETVTDFIFSGFKITADSDCSHEIKRYLLLGRKAMANLLLLLLSHFSSVRLCATPSLGFSRQEHWSGLPFPSAIHQSEKWKWSHSVMSDSSWPHGLQPTRLLHPWDFPGKSTGVGCHYLLHGQPRQHIKKQRHYLADKGPSNQSYGFSSSHVLMWELDHKESWVLKNWCFWTVVLEMLESPLDCKEI